MVRRFQLNSRFILILMKKQYFKEYNLSKNVKIYQDLSEYVKSYQNIVKKLICCKRIPQSSII